MECFTACLFPLSCAGKRAQELGWGDRNGGEPHAACGSVAPTGWFFFNSFSKDTFRRRDRSPCVFLDVRCPILSSGRSCPGRLDRFLDDSEESLLAVARAGQDKGQGKSQTEGQAFAYSFIRKEGHSHRVFSQIFLFVFFKSVEKCKKFSLLNTSYLDDKIHG